MTAYVDAAWWASPALGPSRGQRGQVLSYVRPLDAALVGCGPVWCSLIGGGPSAARRGLRFSSLAGHGMPPVVKRRPAEPVNASETLLGIN